MERRVTSGQNFSELIKRQWRGEGVDSINDFNVCIVPREAIVGHGTSSLLSVQREDDKVELSIALKVQGLSKFGFVCLFE